MEKMLFGDRQKFALELADYSPNTNEGRFKFWINNNEVGDFKVKDELDTCKRAFSLLASNKQELYDEAFSSRTEEEIFRYCLLLDKEPENRTVEDYDRFRRIQHLSPFFGEQFDVVTKVIYYKNDHYHFLWSYENDYTSDTDIMQNFKHEKIRTVDFETTCNAFLAFVR